MITIYQIPLNGGLAPRSVIETKSELMDGFKRWKDEYSKLYVRTYEVDTDDLEGSSTSVGDIAVKDGVCYFCDNFGWVALGKYEGLN
jgi:hypothetical protein